MGLEGEVPRHSTFSKNWRGRFEGKDLFRSLFYEVVDQVMDKGLVGRCRLSVDATLVRAAAAMREAASPNRFPSGGKPRCGHFVSVFWSILASKRLPKPSLARLPCNSKAQRFSALEKITFFFNTLLAPRILTRISEIVLSLKSLDKFVVGSGLVPRPSEGKVYRCRGGSAYRGTRPLPRREEPFNRRISFL